MQETQYLLTTKDNPYNPWIEYDLWNEFDTIAGHYTASKLARLAPIEIEFSERLNVLYTNQAIDRLIELDFEKKYVKVKKPTP